MSKWEINISSRAARIIKCVLSVALLTFILCAWPGYLVHDEYVSRSFSERYEPSDVLPSGSVVTQYFVPQRGHLSHIEFALLFNDENVENGTIRFALYEESGREILSQDIPFDQMRSEGYYNIRINKRLKAGETYYWMLTDPHNGGVDLQIMYTNHLADQAPENTLFLLNDEQFGEISQTISQYTYYIHPDKIIIIGTYWVGAVLIYIICMDIVSRMSESQ